MIISYSYFIKKLNSKIKSNENFYYELVKTVLSKPERYTGIFRLSSIKTKLMQNVTQSREIKFGDFMEEIMTDYLGALGYKNLPKNIGQDEEGNELSADQIFIKDNIVYLIEQKIRDDHDSTKKRGQFLNFKKKYTLLKKLYPNCKIIASMWFIDESLTKNKNYYTSEMKNETLVNTELHIFYGSSIFKELLYNEDVWNELTSYLLKNKMERSNELLSIPDFDTSDEIFSALCLLKKDNSNLITKLFSNNPKYVQLRRELFPTGYNLKRLKINN